MANPGNNYAWWVGQDKNIWANIDGDVQKINYANRSSDGNILGNKSTGLQNIVKLFASNQIADPNTAAKNGAGEGAINTTSRYSSGSGSGSGSSAAADANMRSIYDRQIGDINSNINSLQGQLNNALAGVKSEYNTYKNEQQSQYNANKNDYDNSTLQNRQNLRTNRNDITDRASEGLRGLLSILGAMGAGGGSVARYEAPRMVVDQANREFDNASSTYKQNQQNLDTDWGNYKNQFENDRKKLEDWYTGQVKAKKQENYEKGLSLLQDLASAYANRSQYGGDYKANFDDTYKRIADYRSRINDLGKFVAPKYTGTTAVYKAPELASYDTGNTDLSTQVIDSNTSASSPLLVALQGLNKKKTNSPYADRSEA